MPVVNVHLLEGRSVDQKRAIAKDITDSICTHLQKDPTSVRVIFSDMKQENFAVAGTLIVDKE